MPKGHKWDAEVGAKLFWESVTDTFSRGCWVWVGRLSKRYGVVSYKLGDTKPRDHGSHRIAYTLLRGPIPDGLTIDHLCRNTLCQNPDHFELCTSPENRSRARSQFCQDNHPQPAKGAVCYECGRISRLGYRKRRKARSTPAEWRDFLGNINKSQNARNAKRKLNASR